MRTVSVMNVTNINVSNAMKRSARNVLFGRKSESNLSVNVTTVINAIAGDAMTMKKMILFTHAVSDVAMIADSEGIDSHCIAQMVWRVWNASSCKM